MLKLFYTGMTGKNMLMKKMVFLFMILPICLVVFNNSAYRHQHILPNGNRIEHAHPFQSCRNDSEPGKGHQHTEREYLLYSLITDSQVVFSRFCYSPWLFSIRESNSKLNDPTEVVANESISFGHLRAPPPLFYSLV